VSDTDIPTSMTVSEAAAALSVSRTTIYALINAERLVVDPDAKPLRVTDASVWQEYDLRYPDAPPRAPKRRWWQRLGGTLTTIVTKVALARWGKT
jgi:hypothetical protein